MWQPECDGAQDCCAAVDDNSPVTWASASSRTSLALVNSVWMLPSVAWWQRSFQTGSGTDEGAKRRRGDGVPTG